MNSHQKNDCYHFIPIIAIVAALALLLNVCDNYQKQAQNNTVAPTQIKEMDRVVGFEPTTSASFLSSSI
jgi:hypothetical protein